MSTVYKNFIAQKDAACRGRPNEHDSKLDQDRAGLTPLQWLICIVAGIGFAFDLYETLMLPLILRPALADLGNLARGTRAFNLWRACCFSFPARLPAWSRCLAAI